VIYGPGGTPIYQINATGEIIYLHQDHQGSTRLVTNANGTTRGAMTYDAHGQITANTNPWILQQPLLGYTGQYHDTETGYIYLRARHYDPATGQFTSVDPLVAITEEPYGYVGGNPVNRTDPSGLCGYGDPLGCVEDWTERVVDGVIDFSAEVSGGRSEYSEGFKTALHEAERRPDYITIDLSAYIGINIVITRDGTLIVGPQVGTVGASVRLGWLNSVASDDASRMAFLTEHGSSITGGFAGASCGATYGYGGWATEVGIGTEGPGVSHSYNFEIVDLPLGW
jgi:RHS repeat-associated protein